MSVWQQQQASIAPLCTPLTHTQPTVRPIPLSALCSLICRSMKRDMIKAARTKRCSLAHKRRRVQSGGAQAAQAAQAARKAISRQLIALKIFIRNGRQQSAAAAAVGSKKVKLLKLK